MTKQRYAPDDPAIERALADALIRGESDSRTQFVERCHHAVYTQACRLESDPELRRDWTHDCLLRLLDDLSSGKFTYRHPGSLWAWFRQRAWFLLLESRRTYRRRLGFQVADGDTVLDTVPAPHDPERDLTRHEIADAVEHCLDSIASADQRQVLRLLLHQELPYQDIASTVDAPLNTVRAWIRRGRLALRQCVAGRLELEADHEDLQ